jgi:hypothetical protein
LAVQVGEESTGALAASFPDTMLEVIHAKREKHQAAVETFLSFFPKMKPWLNNSHAKELL